MSQKMTREELVDLVETITTMRNKSTNELLSEKEIHALVLKFEKNIKNFEIPEKFICILQLSPLQSSTPVP